MKETGTSASTYQYGTIDTGAWGPVEPTSSQVSHTAAIDVRAQEPPKPFFDPLKRLHLDLETDQRTAAVRAKHLLLLVRLNGIADFAAMEFLAAEIHEAGGDFSLAEIAELTGQVPF